MDNFWSHKRTSYYLWEAISNKLRWTYRKNEYDKFDSQAMEEIFRRLIDQIIDASLPNSIPGTGLYALNSMGLPTMARMCGKRTDGTYGFDPDARVGHRTPTQNHPHEFMYGYDVMAMVRTPLAGEDMPFVLDRLYAVPATGDQTSPLEAMIDSLTKAGYKVNQIIADRYYSNLLPENFAYPLREKVSNT